jgi:hypothetical protein
MERNPTRTDDDYGFTLGPNDALSERVGCRVDVLDFSTTATGTHKIIKAHAALARCPADEYIAITSGNFGFALKTAAEIQRKKVHLVIGRARERLKPLLEGEFTEIHYIEDLQRCNPFGPYDHLMPSLSCSPSPNLSAGHLVASFKAMYRDVVTNLKDITTCKDIKPGKFAHHDRLIYDVLNVWQGEMYDAVFVPTGSGELLSDLVQQKMGRDPCFYGICPKGHPFTRGANYTEFNPDVPPSRMDKLVTPVISLREDDLRYDDYHWPRIARFLEASERDSERADAVAREAGLRCEPSGAAACAFALPSFRRHHGIRISPNDAILVVNTGDGGLPR